MATILIFFLTINLLNFVQFKEHQGKILSTIEGLGAKLPSLPRKVRLCYTVRARSPSGGVAICISGFVDDVMFAIMGHIKACRTVESAASSDVLRRRTQVNAPAATYWLRHVV